MRRIVVLGEAAEELFLIDHDDLGCFKHLEVGDQVDIDRAEFHVGGAAVNAAVTLARHDHQVVYLGNLGHDVAGDAILACFDRENIDSSHINISEGHTACHVMLIDSETGRRTELSFRGSFKNTNRLDPATLSQIDADWLYMTSLGGNMNKILEFFEKARHLGMKIFWNPGPAELSQIRKLKGLLSDVDILQVNKPTAAKIVPGEILTELISRLGNYCPIVLITDGIMGAAAKSTAGIWRLGAYEQGKIKDTSGSGEAFGAGFLASWAGHENEPDAFENALKFASANAAKILQSYGGNAAALTGSEKLHPMPIMKM